MPDVSGYGCVCKSSFYGWQHKPESLMEKENKGLIQHIKSTFEEQPGRCGTETIKRGLSRLSCQVSRRRESSSRRLI
jgi:hypothetical protein